MSYVFLFFFFNDTATTEIYTLSLHDALPICTSPLCEGRSALPGRTICVSGRGPSARARPGRRARRSRPSGRSRGSHFGSICGVSSFRTSSLLHSDHSDVDSLAEIRRRWCVESLNPGGTSMAYVDIV